MRLLVPAVHILPNSRRRPSQTPKPPATSTVYIYSCFVFVHHRAHDFHNFFFFCFPVVSPCGGITDMQHLSYHSQDLTHQQRTHTNTLHPTQQTDGGSPTTSASRHACTFCRRAAPYFCVCPPLKFRLLNTWRATDSSHNKTSNITLPPKKSGLRSRSGSYQQRFITHIRVERTNLQQEIE